MDEAGDHIGGGEVGGARYDRFEQCQRSVVAWIETEQMLQAIVDQARDILLVVMPGEALETADADVAVAETH